MYSVIFTKISPVYPYTRSVLKHDMKWRVVDTPCLGITSLLCSNSIVHGRAIVEEHSRLTQSTEMLSYETDVSERSFEAQADTRTRPKEV